jgi:hypothetical protein
MILIAGLDVSDWVGGELFEIEKLYHHVESLWGIYLCTPNY